MRKYILLITLLMSQFDCFTQTITYSGSTTLCPGGSLLLTVGQPNPVPTYQWQMNGSNVGSNSNTYTVNAAGSYRVILTVGGNSDTSNTLIVSDTTNPIPAFTFPATVNCSNIPVTFTNSSGVGLTYEWNFDDLNSGSNNSATVSNPTHTFIGTPGNTNQSFNVSLTARNSFGCIGTITRTVTTKQLPSTGLDGPNARNYNGSIYFRNCSSDAAAIFEFTNASTTVNSGYKIIWGDGSPDSIFNSFTGVISHSYNIGTTPLSFIVSGNGCIDTTTYFIYVGSNPAVGLGNPGNTTICTGVSLTFPISGTSTNTPGTTYTVTFNDGSAPVTFNHPAPADVTHNFINGSCGTTTQTTPIYTNSFSATIEASNPCLTSAATVVPIYVSVKPAATFTVSPKDTTCVGITTTITNTSITNNYINAPNCTPGKFVWNISPSTGWSLSSGSLGSDNGSPNAGSWSSLSTNAVGIIFTQPGVYTVKLRVGNPVCGKDSIVKTICVNPTPIADFNLDQNIGCAPLSINTTNIPSANNCGSNTYNWNVTYSPTTGCLPATSAYSFISGTNAGSVNPKFQFDNPGVYTVSLTAISPAGSCSSAVVSKVITVKGKPQASINAASSICKGESIIPTVTTSCYIDAATSYAWTFTGGNPATSNTNPPGSVTYNTSGNYNIAVNVTNECGVTSVSKAIAVNDVTIAAAGPSQNICGTVVTMAANTAVIGTGEWTNVSGPNIPSITNSASPSTTITGLTPGTYIFRWTIANGNCSSQSDVTITISAGASAANAGSDQNLCLNSSTTLAANTPAIGTGMWSQVSGAAATIADATNPATTVTGLTPGNYVFRWTISFSNCTANTDDVQVIIYDNPSPADAGTDQTICSASTTLTGNTPVVGNGTWTQIGSTPAAATITTASSASTTVTGLNNPGTYQFKWTISNGPCVPRQDTVAITVTEVGTTAAAGNDIDACIGSTVTLAGNIASVGSGSWSIVSGASGATITNTSSPSSTVTGLNVGIHVLKWTITNGNCPTTDDNVQITVYDNPSSANAGTDQTICSASATLSGNTPVIGNGTWTQIGNTPAAATITSASSANTAVTGLSNPGTYQFKWTISNGPCASTQDTVAITVTQVGTTAAAGNDIEVCIGSTVTLAGNTASVGTGLWSIVSGASGATITNNSSSTSTVTGLSVGTHVLKWTITNGNCPSTDDNVQITVYDNPSIANAGTDQTICSASATLNGNTPVIGNGTWTQIGSTPATATIITATSANTLVSGLSTPGSYQFKWTITNGPCNTTQDTVIINITEVATSADAGTDIRQCAVSSVNMAGNIATVGIGVWTYVSGPSGYSITNSGDPATSITGLVPGSYVFRWTITNGNCPPSIDDVQVIIDEAVTPADAGPAQDKCGVSVVMSANTPLVGSGQWTFIDGPSGSSFVNSSSANTTINGLVPGTYNFRWTITNGSCSSSSDVAITIFSGASTAVAGSDQELCLATTAILNATAPVVGMGQWSQERGPTTATIGNSSNNSTAINGLVPGIYVFRWTVSYSNCTPNTDEVQITIYDNPTGSAAGPDQTICAASSSLAANAPLIGNGVWSQISGPSPATIADLNSPSSLVSDLIPGLYRFKWTISSGPCAASEDIVEINVSAIATTANAGPDSVYCNLTSVNLIANIAVVGTGLWSFVNGPNTASVTTPGLNTTSVTGLVPGTYIFRWTITSGVCPPSIDDVEIRILNNLQNINISAVDTICAGQQAVLNGTIPTGGTGTYSYQWQQSTDGINWTDITGETNQNLSILLNNTTFFQRKVISLPCEAFSNVIKIFVQPGIANNNIGADNSICINTDAPLLNGSTPSGGDGLFSYQWQLSIDGGLTWLNIPNETTINYDPGILIQTTKYRRLVSTALCSGPQSDISNVVTITINPDSKAIFTASDTEDCDPFDLNTVISVTHLPDSNGNYNWYADNSFIGSTTDGTFAGYTINTPGDTIDIKLVTASPFGCKADSMQIQFTTFRTAVATFTKDTAGGCGPLTVNFTNTSSIINSTIEFFWNFGNGITSTDAQPAPVTFIQSPEYRDTLYHVVLKAYNGCDTTVWRDSIKIRTNPKARFALDTTAGCSPFHIVVTNTSLGEPNTYYWDFGNGDLDTTFSNGSFNYTYNIGNEVDTFPIRLIAVNECFSDTQTINVRVAPNIIRPQVTVSASELFGCTSHTVSFINATTGATQFTWNYGDGSPVDITNNVQTIVTHTFNTPGAFTVAIDMTNGCSDTTVYTQVTVYAKPVATFTTNAAQYCLGDTIKLSNTSTDANNFRWFWGDGQSSNGFEPTHVYTTPGSYNIVLRAERTNSSGLVCMDSFVQSITILVKPDVRVQTNIANPLCVPFTLNATAPGIIDETVTWYITDTTVSATPIIQNGINANYTFSKPGTFTLKMMASNSIGCSDSTILTFVVRGVPVASFTPTAISTCITDTTVNYQNTSSFNDFGPLTYRWLVDNTLQGTNGNFTYRYTVAGNTVLPKIFNTQLVAINSVGCSDTATGIVQISPVAKAQFTIINPNECPPFMLGINNVSQYATTYKWFLNGVLQDTAAAPSILIADPLNSYTVTLVADNFFGCTPDTFVQTFTSRTKPDAGFTVNDTIGCSGNLNIITTNNTSRASGYIWDWGDATAQTSFINPTHLYNTQGQYIISLVASDGTCRDTAYQTVYVSQKPAADFSINDSVTCDTARIHFTNLTTGATNYLWTFSDNTTSSLFEPDKNFPPSLSYYTVKLEASNSLGCSDAVIKANLILAKLPPAGDFVINPSPTISIPQYTFSFENITLDNNDYTYRWDLGDGTFANTRDVVEHKYNDTGSYNVMMIVFDNNNGCPDTTIKIARIQGQPGYLFVPNAFYPNSLQVQFRNFKPVGKGLAEYKFQVFDAWGKLLFETMELDAAGSPVIGWDGTDMKTKKPMPQDAYAWRIVAKFRNGRQWDGMSYSNNREGSPGNTFGTVTLFR